MQDDKDPNRYEVDYDSSYGFTIMFFLMLGQLIYAIHKKAPEAIRLDAALFPGTIMILSDYFSLWWLLDFQMMFFILGDFYLVTKLRDIQGTGTHPILQSIFLAIVLVFSIIFLFSNENDHSTNTAYYSGFVAC